MAKILLVEDDDMLLDMMQQTLELAEYTVVTAHNGAVALTRVRSDRPDLILMDIEMPELDGYEATRLLKADAATRAIPVIALSAHASNADRQQALDAGANDYEPKPVNLDALLEKIATLLQGGGS